MSGARSPGHYGGVQVDGQVLRQSLKPRLVWDSGWNHANAPGILAPAQRKTIRRTQFAVATGSDGQDHQMMSMMVFRQLAAVKAVLFNPDSFPGGASSKEE